MASPQKENGFTPVANEIIENLCQLRLSGYEWQIIMVVLRKTYGWNKPHDRISLSQFSQMTKIQMPHVSRTLKKLIKKNIITQIGNSYPLNYSFQKDYEKYLPKQVTLPKQVISITQTGNKSLPKQVTTKDNTKDIYKDTPAVVKNKKPEHVILAELFAQNYKKLTNQPYKLDKEQFIIMSKLIKDYSYDTVKQKAIILLEMCIEKSAWFTKNGGADFTINKLAKQWNEIIENES